ncbi:acyltransferase domain-containing protein [Burkholderia gladioli]|uniref:Acyltransferase domain-containing protein n=1 Tax=Burkholderia gladioli TaxID=28095 RepID=A0AB38TYH7_BURGA|nr:acyltransferase domain-containing protein [Burkholderia gladioli]MBU9271977.1 acyltransferase domain-containing protein [Burkholderia gladioli]MBU9325465.1 acyltransferase domain-containing protein [Burkholderia gladioli]MDN7500563.1 acyltransferase domain-containing protein [Burkholderia gladioli]MDN7752350.1 acyltransferase domain-containing protein [Burkholderia gladioli]MDN7808754.1 acyltransferase domain-containing protein [Burkholderia gladioli]
MNQPGIAFLFSGQGAQYHGMGQPLYEQAPVFRREMDRLDAVVRDLAGLSLVDRLYREGRPRSEPLDRTLVSHPAIFMVEYALARLLIESGVEPDAALGASLGAFIAAAVAGCLAPDDALALLIGHAQALEAHCEPGTMIAVFAPSSWLEASGFGDRAELAALGIDAHCVVSARLADALEIERCLGEQDIVYQRLPVSFPFHSRWTRAAAAPMAARLDAIGLRAGRFPIACSTGEGLVSPLRGEHLIAALREPIRFQHTLRIVDAAREFAYVDVGPSGTLAAQARSACTQAAAAGRIHTTMSMYARDVENVAAVVSALGGRHRSAA